ncbi:MAG: hypothetical protein ACRDBR_00785 [Metamycoplasmataceae bacterium]
MNSNTLTSILSTKMIKHLNCVNNIISDESKIYFIESVAFNKTKIERLKGILIFYSDLLVFSSKRRFGKVINIINLSDIEKIGYINQKVTKLVIFLKQGKNITFSGLSLKKTETMAIEINKKIKSSSV